MKEWIKFDYDDGAEVFYNIDKKMQLLTLKHYWSKEMKKNISIYFDEIKEVYDKIKLL